MNTRAVSQPVQAVVISAIVLATLCGAFILAINDRNLNPIGLPNPIETLVAVVSRTPIGTQVAPPRLTTPGATDTITPTPTPTLTPTPVCPQPPADWVQVEFNQSQISLVSFAWLYNTPYERLIEVNCLDKIQLQAIQQLYVPATAPTSVPTVYAITCYPLPGWSIYVVQWGDTLSKLSVRYGVSIEVLMRYNCLASTRINQGQRLYVPYVPIATWTPPPTWTPLPSPTWTPTPSPTWTPTPLDTPTPVVPPSDTPTPTWTPIPTDTPTIEVPTETPTTIAPPTWTPTPSPTLEPTATLPPPPTETPAAPTLPASPLGTPVQ